MRNPNDIIVNGKKLGDIIKSARQADLSGADLSWADLRWADLDLDYLISLTSIIPDGDIIGWKKARGGMIMLKIPAESRRSNATGRKCRCEYAIDVKHFTLDGKETKDNFTSTYDNNFIYKIGETIRAKKWDENRWNECSNGIHFFITRKEAEDY